MIDVLIYENGSGGELSLKNGDIETTDGLFNQLYLAHFGGNTEANTTGEETEGTERFDWWGNQILFTEPNAQMNSNLERALNNNPLSSAGRLEIERQSKLDLEYLSEIADVNSSVSLLSTDKVKISDSINKIVNSILWDATSSEIITERTI